MSKWQSAALLTRRASLSALASAAMAGGTGNAAAAIVHGTGLPSSLPGRNSIRMWMGGEFGGTDYGRFTFGNGFRTGLRFSRTQYVLVTGVHFGITSAKKGQESHSNGPGIGLGAKRLAAYQNIFERLSISTREPNPATLKSRVLDLFPPTYIDFLQTQSNFTSRGKAGYFEAFGQIRRVTYRPPSFSDQYELFHFTVGSQTDYGWLELSLTNNSSEGPYFTPIVYAYDTSGKPIPAGYTGIPEPPQLPLALSALALGAVGLREWRKKRKQTDA